jgi:hypothetical protein
MRVRHVACGVRRCMWVWRLREDRVELSRCACVRKGRGRMCGSPLTYRARQAAVPRRDGHGSHAPPGAACRHCGACSFSEPARAGPVILVKKSFARPSGSSFGVREIAIWSRIMILYETISRGLAVRCRPARVRGGCGGPAPVARWR